MGLMWFLLLSFQYKRKTLQRNVIGTVGLSGVSVHLLVEITRGKENVSGLKGEVNFVLPKRKGKQNPVPQSISAVLTALWEFGLSGLLAHNLVARVLKLDNGQLLQKRCMEV